MDDVPSRSTESRRSENENAARGIHDVATEFAAIWTLASVSSRTAARLSVLRPA